MSDLKREFKTFMDDIEKNIKDPKDLEFIKKRVTGLFDVILNEIERITNFKEEKIAQMEQKQQQLDAKMQRIEEIVGNIEKDIYDEDGFDFEILCPYCNAEFVVDMDEDQLDVTCPECHNVIELDWSGNVEDDGFGCTHGGCSTCGGCETALGIDKEEKREKDEDDDM